MFGSGKQAPLTPHSPLEPEPPIVPSQYLHSPHDIQIPMLGPLQGIQQVNQQMQQNQQQHPQQQQQQQQQQQPQQQHQQGQQQQPGGQNGGIPPPPPLNGQDFTLSSVLHFLQTEWRRYERDRNEWEIERAEMRARIAQLEGERRSFENVKVDLMRRIKMLEYALRMERSKQLSSSSGTQTIAPSKLATVQAQAAQADDAGSHKEGTSGSSPRSEDSPLPEHRVPNGSTNAHAARPSSWSGNNWGTGSGTLAGVGKPPPGRDPKSRARSRDYLKQNAKHQWCKKVVLIDSRCLQEISYLTSPQAMNPLPNRPLLNNTALPLALPNVPSFDQMAYNGRPRKILPEAAKEFPSLNGMGLMSGPSSSVAPGSQMQPPDRGNPIAASMPLQPNQPQQHIQMPPQPQMGPQLSQPHIQMQQQSDKEKDDEEPRQLTAIYRPDEDWRERLRESNEQARMSGLGGVSGWDTRDDEKDEEPEVEEDDSVLGENESGGKVWKSKRTLRNHLDAVRALAFHPTELVLATGGDDCTVKIWKMDVASLASSNARPTTEVEPQLTLRGHSAAVTRLIHSPSKGLIYSASLDSSIRIWALPAPGHTTYAPYDETRARGELVGHTDAVWDLSLVRDESALISCGAEGTIKVWDVSGPSGGGSLRLTWGWAGLETPDELQEDSDTPAATAVEAMKTDLKKVAAAFQNAVIKIFDIDTGKELTRLPSDVSYDGTKATQVNRIVSHPTMNILVTAHEDKFVRVFDIVTGQCTHSITAHLDGVTSLSIDPLGFSLVSGSHDCSIRFWDLLGSCACAQEITSHREKAREGVLDVEFHPTLPFMASAGADGVVKLFASS